MPLVGSWRLLTALVGSCHFYVMGEKIIKNINLLVGSRLVLMFETLLVGSAVIKLSLL